MATAGESTPLLWDQAYKNPHDQFCLLAGVPPSDRPSKNVHIAPKTLYGRATRQYQRAKTSYSVISVFSNTLLLSQVIIGAALTALGASESSHILITLFGALNTIIAGLVAYLKSRGQPTRARMYRDDLERVVDEIENSEIMWLGISDNVHGYDEIDVDGKVTVRSEVARLMRLYERAVANNMLNNPDNYLLASGRDSAGTALRARPGPVAAAPAGPSAVPPPQILAADTAPPPVAPPLAASADTEVSPASAPPKPKPVKEDAPKKDDPPKKEDPPTKADAKPAAAPEPPTAAKPAPDAKPAAETPKEAPEPVHQELAAGEPITTAATTVASDDPDASPATTDPAPKADKSKKVEKSQEESSKSSDGPAEDGK